jgi:hypothetical protein
MPPNNMTHESCFGKPVQRAVQLGEAVIAAKRCRFGALALLVAVLATGASDCGFANKRAVADRIRKAPERLQAVGTANAAYTVSVRVLKSTAESGLTPGAVVGARRTVPASLDYRNRLAALTVGQPPQPLQVIEHTWLYQRRLGAPGSSQRQWLRLDLAGLYPDRKRLSTSTVGGNLVGPATVVDIVRGVLTGSVKADGQETIAGAPTTRYKVNVDLDKAFKHAPTSQREAFEAVRVLGGMTGVVHPGRVWLDPSGQLRRVELRLRQHFARNVTLELTVDMQLSALGGPVAIALPPKQEVADVGDVSALAAAMQSSRDTGAAGAGAVQQPAPQGSGK